MKNKFIPAIVASIIIAFSGANVIALAEKYPLNITASAKDDETAEIRISGVIHQWQNSAVEFKQKIDALIVKGIKNVVLYINTPGGSVFEANEIANEIKRFKGTISGFGGALVASAGSYLALICDTFELADNGQYMYHKPMGSIFGNEDKVTADLKLLQNLTNQYRTAYAEKTGMSEDAIEANWVKGDVWLSAKEAKEAGFITSVSSKKESITEDQQAMFVACGAPKIPNVKSNSLPIMKNRNAIISKLGLASDATDEQIEKAIAKAMDDSSKVKDLQTANAEALKVNAEKLVDKAIVEKKITADLKEQYLKFAISDLAGTTAIIESMASTAKLSEQISAQGTPEAKGREKWTLEDYMEKDPTALDKMMVDNPKAFAELEAVYFAK